MKNKIHNYMFVFVQEPLAGHGLFIIMALWLHSHTPHLVGFPWMSHPPTAETSTWQHTPLKNRENSKPLAGFKLAIPATKQPQTHALGRMATGINQYSYTWPKIMFPTSSGKWSVQNMTQREGSNARQLHVGFVCDKAASERVFLQVLWISPVSIIPPVLHPHSFICHCHYKYSLLTTTSNKTCKLPL